MNSSFAAAFASKCGTLYLPCSVGMRSSASGTHFRVSSKVDQMACRIPARFAASARFVAWAVSFSGEKCSQKFVTQ